MSIEKGIALALNRWWKPANVIERYGVDLWTVPTHLMAQYRIWVEKYSSRDQAYRTDEINRFVFETFLQHRELVPLRFAAVELGMKVVSFREMLQSMAGKGLIGPSEEQGVYPDVFAAQFIRDVHRRLPSFPKRMTFSGQTAFIRSVHKVIETDLGFIPDAENCVTSATIGEIETEAACDFDILTNEPIGLQFQVWLDFKKPINLRPDACSALTFLRNEAALTSHLLGSRDDDVLAPVRAWLAANKA